MVGEVLFYGLFCLSCRKKESPVSNAVMPVIIIAVLPVEPDVSCVKRITEPTRQITLKIIPALNIFSLFVELML